jgi:hypothetical protein
VGGDDVRDRRRVVVGRCPQPIPRRQLGHQSAEA